MATDDTPIQGELLLFPESNSERMPIGEFAEKAYLNYSMYVILDRALPHISDGLKPVQRRIIYAMSELGLSATAKYKKSARTVGDVIGKFHPHGDSAAYEAMVLMAQPFSFRYPIIDGQGNWGSIDNPKSFAAMRYTECRFTPYSEILLNELSPDTVDWVPNFDGTLNEPERLPAQLPNVLLNGSSGIAVGMATDIPPHNLAEIAAACVQLIKHPRTSLKKLLEIVPAPDFPGGADIVASKEELRSIYELGQGSVRQRAVWEKLPREIVISALPHQVSSARALEQIAAQMKKKKIPMVVDLNDESNEEEPVRIVLELRSNRVNCDALMNHLFAKTDLEKNQRVNLNMIALHGRPVVYGLKELLTEWVEFRRQTVRRRLESRLNFVTNRLHVLDGFFIVFLNLDEVIHVIRTYDDAKSELMDQFNLSERQVKSILEIRLRQLAKLEEFKIREEQHALRTERDDLEKLLRSKAKFKQLICQEIITASKKHGDQRRSQICENQPLAKAFTEEELAPVEPLTVVLSKMGWIRAAKGHEVNPGALSYREGDSYFVSVRGKSNIPLICMDSSGRMYTIHPRSLPSARSVGEPLTSIINPASNVEFTGGLVMADENTYCLLAHRQGKGLVVQVKDMISRSRSGKIVFRVQPEHSVFPMVQFASMDDLAVVVTTAGRLLIYPVSELPIRAKGSGIRLINIPKKAGSSVEVSCVHVFSRKKSLLLHSGKKYRRIRPREVNDFIGSRNSTGILLPRGYRGVSRITVRD